MIHIAILIYILLIFGQQCNAQNGCQTIKCTAITVCDNCAAPFDCQPSCENPMGKNCPTKTCSAACVCGSGYIRSANGTCVTLSQCQTTEKVSTNLTTLGTGSSSENRDGFEPNSMTCGENEQFYGCGACDGTCIKPNVVCPLACIWPGGCGCSPGFVRDTTTSVCVNELSKSCAAQRTGSAV